MKSAIITVVIDDADGVDVQKLIEAKTVKELKASIESELPKIIKNFHKDNEALETEGKKYIDDVVEDFMNGDMDVYVPSGVKGSGFVQIFYL